MKKLLLAGLVAALCSVTLISTPAIAQVPQLINYQGRVVVGTVNFDGSGQFKFALVNANGTVTYWSNDGTSTAGSQPTAAVALTVTKGLYSVLLGDATLTNMTAVPATVFSNADVRLRVWFNDGTNGSQLLTPDQRIAAVGYAMVAGNAAIAQTVPDGAITSAKIASGAVQAGNLAPGKVFSWQSVAGTSQLAQANTGYTANDPARVTVTLPAAPNVGDTVRFLGAGAGGWSIAANAGQAVLGGGATGATWAAHNPVKDWFFVASSATGSKLLACVNNEFLYTSTYAGNTWTPRLTDASRLWRSVASSADGAKLVAAGNAGRIYTSTDSGVSWTARATSENWTAVASSIDGVKLAAAIGGDRLYTSIDSGVTWTLRVSHNWTALASSADGTKLVGPSGGDQIYTSGDSGATWIGHNPVAAWNSAASSADGIKLVATTNGGQIYTSTDSGLNWTPRDSNRAWSRVSSSADGTNLAATVYGGQIYTSSDSGATWIARESVRNWQAIASSGDGNNLVAAVAGGQIYSSQQYLTGAQGSTAELQYIGNGQWQGMNQRKR